MNDDGGGDRERDGGNGREGDGGNGQGASAAASDATRVLIHAPFGRDGSILARLAAEHGQTAFEVATPDRLREEIEAGFGVLVVTEEGLSPAAGAALAATLDEQPSWSAAPILALVTDAGRPPAGLLRLRAVEPRLHLVIVQRPARARSIGSALLALRRSRERQYLVRDQLAELRAREDRLGFLLAELDHRAKNALAKAQSLAYLTARHSEDVPSFVEAFGGRLAALARAHDLLAGEHGRSADLRGLLEECLAPYARGDGAHFRLDGPDVPLRSRTALTLAMVLYELTTNAAKHGALSSPSGTVRVEWRLSEGEPRDLRMEWRESGGPPARPPGRRGFGTTLIERLAVKEFNGEASLTFAPEGVTYRLRVPAPAVTAADVDAADGPGAAGAAARTDLAAD